MEFSDHLPKMRLTTQRQVILEELGKVTSHPTANEVYDMVRKRLPRIGLGTVYRNLELMAESGLILKLEVGGTQKRFDATTDLHYHIRFYGLMLSREYGLEASDKGADRKTHVRIKDWIERGNQIQVCR